MNACTLATLVNLDVNSVKLEEVRFDQSKAGNRHLCFTTVCNTIPLLVPQILIFPPFSHFTEKVALVKLK